MCVAESLLFLTWGILIGFGVTYFLKYIKKENSKSKQLKKFLMDGLGAKKYQQYLDMGGYIA